jgi:RHS repeat-associated protein
VVDSASGSIAQRLDYDEFGRVALDTNPGFQPFGFAGGLYDYQTGLVHFGARDYDPGIGRWLTKDPIGFAGRDYNLYRYAYGDPINLIDVDGMNAGFLATGWGIALGEPTPIGEVVMGVATTGILLWGLWQAIDSDDDADKIKQSPPPEVAEPMENVDLPVSEPRGLDCPEAPFPGFDPTRPPGPDYEWKGSDQPGKGPGSWHNPKTGDSLNPDLDHPPPPGPHWDWKHKGEGGKPGYRISPDGTITPKG